MRRATHYGYVWIITPAAILAIFIGSALILMRDVFTVWIFVKLILVTGLVAVHAWVGHTIVAVAETEGQLEPPEPLVSTIVILGLVKGILFLVLVKPELEVCPCRHGFLRLWGVNCPLIFPADSRKRARPHANPLQKP